MSKIKLICYWCKKEYLVYPSIIRKQKKEGVKFTFCCRQHKYEWNKTIPGFWKGKKMSLEARQNMSENHADFTGNKNGRWQGGKRIDKDGYVLVWRPSHPNSDYHGYVREHRLVFERFLQRYLSLKEVIHHKDGNKINNQLENLELYENGAKHQKHHYPTARQLKHSPAWKVEHSSSS